MQLESSNRAAARAVATLEKSARAEAVSFKSQAKAIGKRRQTVSRKYRTGDMLMSEFLAIASQVGADPSAIIADAVNTEKKKMPAADTAGEETRKDNKNGSQQQ